MTGKQSDEERKANKRKYKRTAGAAERAVLAKRLKRMETKHTQLEEALTKKKDDLIALGIGPIPADGNEKELVKLLQSPRAHKLHFLETTTGVPLDGDSPEDRVNRLVQHAYSMKMTHKAEGRRPFTFKKRFQEEFRQVAMSAEQISQGVLEKFFGRLIREKLFPSKRYLSVKIVLCEVSSLVAPWKLYGQWRIFPRIIKVYSLAVRPFRSSTIRSSAELRRNM